MAVIPGGLVVVVTAAGIESPAMGYAGKVAQRKRPKLKASCTIAKRYFIAYPASEGAPITPLVATSQP